MQPLTQRVLITAIKAACKFLIDDHNLRRVGGVAFIEIATHNQPDAHRLEILRRNYAAINKHSLIRTWLWITFLDYWPNAAAAVSHQQKAGDRNVLHAGLRFDPFEQLDVKALSRWSVITKQSRIELHGDDVLGVKAGIGPECAVKASDE